MKAITFHCHEILAERPEAICQKILDLSNWTDFQGYGMLPGIRDAAYELKTPEIVGSRIRVTMRRMAGTANDP